MDHASEAQIESLLEAVAGKPVGTDSQELDELVFYWRDVTPYLEKNGRGPLSPEWHEFLRNEVQRREVRVWVRVLGDDDTLHLEWNRVVHLGIKAHLHADVVNGVQPPEFSGTVQRTALNHIWARF